MTWTQGEDELVAAGMYRYGLDLDLISRHLVPVKTAKEIQARQRNRCHRVEGNCIRVRPAQCVAVTLLHGLCSPAFPKTLLVL